jgi:hypothetical protein
VIPGRRAPDVYPGTHRPVRPAVAPDWAEPEVTWDANPIHYLHEGSLREFFGIGHLADALVRSTKTIYKWETRGIFPYATFVFNPSSLHGRRRYYTRVQVEGVMVIAAEEGVLTREKREITQTLFPARCFQLFKETRALLPPPLIDFPQE